MEDIFALYVLWFPLSEALQCGPNQPQEQEEECQLNHHYALETTQVHNFI